LSHPDKIIRGELKKTGVISFERFMQLALYCPDYGFYEKEGDTIGRRGNFFTSVSVGALFGELLAFEFSEWLTAQHAPDSPFKIAEAGAHDARLAGDLLAWMREHRPDMFADLEYSIVEPSRARRDRQEMRLAEFMGKVRWVSRPEELTRASGRPGFRGIFFSNELLDAMPVRRLGWDAAGKTWFEWGVALSEERFVWTRMSGASKGVTDATEPFPKVPKELLEVLPDEFTTEICPAAEKWWRDAAAILQRGRMLTIDYGLAAEEFFSPERAGGTLRAYHQHRVLGDVLANPGEQDITAHVNFTAIQASGEAAGLRTEAFVSQEKFLTHILERAGNDEKAFGEWTPERTRQFQTLTHPEHLGRSFRVLIQSRGMAD